MSCTSVCTVVTFAFGFVPGSAARTALKKSFSVARNGSVTSPPRRLLTFPSVHSLATVSARVSISDLISSAVAPNALTVP